MSKKFSIAKTIDKEKLNKQIYLYMFENCEMNPYLFMNKETLDELKDECFKDSEVSHDAATDASLKEIGVVGLYHCYKIYENNELGFGEVEIR